MAPALKEYLHLSDVKFLVSGKEFYLHKGILGCRSPWFETLCVKGTFKEALEPIIKIESMSADVFGIIIEYLYTGRAFIIPECSVETLLTAHELNLPRLHQICQREIMQYLDENNVLDIYLAAEYHSAETLIEACLNVIVLNFKYISQLEDFKKLSEVNQNKIIAMRKDYESKLLAKNTMLILKYKH